MNIFKKTGLFLGALILLWALGFAAYCITSISRAVEDTNQTSDAIVVLTGGKMRIPDGLGLFASGRSPVLYITGINKEVRRAEILAQWEGATPLPSCCIELDFNATTTTENAQETEIWLRKKNFTSIRLVTGNYHMNRALMEFRHALPDVEIYPHPIKEPDLTLTDQHFWELLFSEYHKTLYRSFQLTFTRRPESFS